MYKYVNSCFSHRTRLYIKNIDLQLPTYFEYVYTKYEIDYSYYDVLSC